MGGDLFGNGRQDFAPHPLLSLSADTTRDFATRATRSPDTFLYVAVYHLSKFLKKFWEEGCAGCKTQGHFPI